MNLVPETQLLTLDVMDDYMDDQEVSSITQDSPKESESSSPDKIKNVPLPLFFCTRSESALPFMWLKGQLYRQKPDKVPGHPHVFFPEPRTLEAKVLNDPSACRGYFDYDSFCREESSNRQWPLEILLYIEDHDHQDLSLEPGQSIVLCLEEPKGGTPFKYVVVKRSDISGHNPITEYIVYGYLDTGLMEFFSRYSYLFGESIPPMRLRTTIRSLTESND